ncbi:DUF4214 domain-containing protein [Neopusillimonas aromaticivorans]|uniref:DUF4214 domain-containing protein n=1 Tax=Neopusillimonas aromaticivorans TaxID=2979868 RepID=UPI0025958D76|nr:DUF4214 domain-containing protein [Neopusillimonas aromaticivorans]WJJ94740.1 DUF4214 domain-containing protein [Neopusillimonas aromaticivorans]
MAITNAMRTEISQLYVALFGRAPDGEGLGFWVQKLDAGASLTSIANEMYGVSAARDYYPDFLSNWQVIESFYINVLGRNPDQAGLEYWTNELNQPGATPGSVITQMISVVTNYVPAPGTPADLVTAAETSKALFINKTDVAQWYGENNGNVAYATSVLGGVTADPASVEAAKAGGIPGLGQTFTLTVNPDTATANVFEAPVAGHLAAPIR